MSLPLALLEQRPIIVAIAGSNGAGKSTFFETFLAQTGLRFINADILGESLQITTYEAAEVASAIPEGNPLRKSSLFVAFFANHSPTMIYAKGVLVGSPQIGRSYREQIGRWVNGELVA